MSQKKHKPSCGYEPFQTVTDEAIRSCFIYLQQKKFLPVYINMSDTNHQFLNPMEFVLRSTLELQVNFTVIVLISISD